MVRLKLLPTQFQFTIPTPVSDYLFIKFNNFIFFLKHQIGFNHWFTVQRQLKSEIFCHYFHYVQFIMVNKWYALIYNPPLNFFFLVENGGLNWKLLMQRTSIALKTPLFFFFLYHWNKIERLTIYSLKLQIYYLKMYVYLHHHTSLKLVCSNVYFSTLIFHSLRHLLKVVAAYKKCLTSMYHVVLKI